MAPMDKSEDMVCNAVSNWSYEGFLKLKSYIIKVDQAWGQQGVELGGEEADWGIPFHVRIQKVISFRSPIWVNMMINYF